MSASVPSGDLIDGCPTVWATASRNFHPQINTAPSTLATREQVGESGGTWAVRICRGTIVVTQLGAAVTGHGASAPRRDSTVLRDGVAKTSIEPPQNSA